MKWIDWMCLVVVLGGAIIQTIRTQKAGGMGLVFFEMLGLIASTVASVNFAPTLANLLGAPPIITLGGLFLSFGILTIIVARLLFGMTQWSFQSLDGFIGFLCGFVTGWVIAHMILRVIIESQGAQSEIALSIGSGPITREVFYFKTWNALIQLLFKARLGPEINANIG